MIEDDLCTLLAGEIGVDVYARLIPIGMPECVMVQEVGGRSSTAGIRRNYRTVAIMSCSSDQETAGKRMREARDYLIEHLPAKINGTHYYTAEALADGTLFMKSANGPRYVVSVDMEVDCSL